MKKLLKIVALTTIIAGAAGVVFVESYLRCEEELSRKEKERWLQSQQE